MGLWCRRAVLPFPSFDWVFSFPSFESGCASFRDILCAFSSVTFIFIFVFLFFPFCLDLIGLGVFVPFWRLLICALL